MGSSMTQAVDLPLRNASPHYVFRAFRLLLLIGGMWLAWTSPAWANQPPGPQMLLAEVLILPLMMLLTLLGGGYAVMRALGVKRRRWLIALAVLAILLTGIQEGLGALLMLLVFGPWALVRGIRLVVWGVKAMRPPARRAAHLVHASPRRLMAAGLLTCFTAVAMVNLSLAFFNWLPPESYKVEGTFKRLVAYEVARGKDHKDEKGQPQYEAPHHDESPMDRYFALGKTTLPFVDSHEAVYWLDYFAMDLRLGPEAHSFQVWVWPLRMPMFPYNYLVTLPSFYADQTGQLRMTRVHKPGQRCPPDAPVYYRVGPEDAPIPR